MIYIYGTQYAEPLDKFLSIYKVWDYTGTDGDGWGRLLKQEEFNDGMCYGPTRSPLYYIWRQAFEPDHLQGPNCWC